MKDLLMSDIKATKNGSLYLPEIFQIMDLNLTIYIMLYLFIVNSIFLDFAFWNLLFNRWPTASGSTSC